MPQRNGLQTHPTAAAPSTGAPDGSSESLQPENQAPCSSASLLQDKSQFADLNLPQSDPFWSKNLSIARVFTEELSRVYNLPEGLTFPAFSKQGLWVSFKRLMQGVGRKKAWVEKLVTNHWIDLMSGRAEIAAGCTESHKAYHCLATLWLSIYSLPVKQNCSAAWAVRMHSIATECTVCVCVSPVSQPNLEAVEIILSRMGKRRWSTYPSGWQWPLGQRTSWPVQYLSFTRSRMGIHFMAKSGFSGTVLVNISKELWRGCTWKKVSGLKSGWWSLFSFEGCSRKWSSNLNPGVKDLLFFRETPGEAEDNKGL